MKMYLLSIGAGALVGVVYNLLGVRSPAPPVIALIELLGILAGDQLMPIGRRVLAGCDLQSAWQQSGCTAHLFGMLLGRTTPNAEGLLRASAKKESQE